MQSNAYDTKEQEQIRLILTVFAKGHDPQTIADALELPLDYVETVLETEEAHTTIQG